MKIDKNRAFVLFSTIVVIYLAIIIQYSNYQYMNSIGLTPEFYIMIVSTIFYIIGWILVIIIFMYRLPYTRYKISIFFILFIIGISHIILHFMLSFGNNSKILINTVRTIIVIFEILWIVIMIYYLPLVKYYFIIGISILILNSVCIIPYQLSHKIVDGPALLLYIISWVFITGGLSIVQ